MRPTVQKAELLGILEENRARHRSVYEAALAGFWREADREWAALGKRIKAGTRSTVYIRLEAPQDHTRDYDRAIRMVTMHQGEVITLSEDDVACYVQDDWGWKRAWLQTSRSYDAAAVAGSYGDDDG